MNDIFTSLVLDILRADAEDTVAALYKLTLENQERISNGLSPLPAGTNSEQLASYKQIALEYLNKWHRHYVAEGVEQAIPRFTDEQRNEIEANFKRRLIAGEDPLSIVTDTAS